MKHYKATQLLTIYLFINLLISCERKAIDIPFPNIETLDINNIDSTGANFGGKISYLGTSSISDYGFVWDTKQKPTLKLGHFISYGRLDSIGRFDGRIEKDLFSNEKYYVRAFAKNEEIEVYGNELNFNSKGSKFKSWDAIPKFESVSRYGAVTFVIGSSAYVGLGYVDEYDPLYLDGKYLRKDFWKYDYSTKQWSPIAPFPSGGRIGAVGFSINGKGYVGTGIGNDRENKKDFWEYDPETNKWTRKSDFPGIGRSGSIGFSFNNKGYIGLGGYSYDGSYIENYKDIWEYNPVQDGWNKKSDFNGNALTDLICITLNEKVYIGLGRKTDSMSSYSPEFWVYDSLNDKWGKLKDFPAEPRIGSAGFSLYNKIYLGAGYSGYRGFVKKPFNDFWEYDPQFEKWTRKPDIIGGLRTMAIGFALNNSGYIGLGTSSKGEIFKYNP